VWSSVCDLLHVTLQASRLLRLLLDFWNMCGNLTYCVIINSQEGLQPVECLLFSIQYLLIFKESVAGITTIGYRTCQKHILL